jgi:hypothetical protein
MKEYNCEECGKKFKQKCHWVNHTQNKKFPCVKLLIKDTKILCGGFPPQKSTFTPEFTPENKIDTNTQTNNNKTINTSKNILEISKIYEKKKNNSICKFCLKQFTRPDSLKRHLDNERCEVLKIQHQQKENIFINLLEEEKIVNQTKKELTELNNYGNIFKKKNNDVVINKSNDNQMEFLMTQIKLLNEKLELQKKESEIKIKESEIKIEQQKNETESKLKLIIDRYFELEKSNQELKKTNEKLQTKMNKIVNKNKITNNTSTTNSNNNITNTVINNPTIKLVNFGSEDLSKISHNVFIETIKSQGAGLYNKAIDGIHFNKDHPENQNIYISDINRGKVMIYKNEKWIIDNWDSVFPNLLDRVIQFGYDKEQFLADCNYRLDGKKFNKQMIKNGIRWYKLLSDDEPDVDYFQLDPEDRPEIDDDTYNDYVEMQKFRKSHPKKETETHIKNKIKLNMYNKREIPIENFKQIELDNKQDNINKNILI